jgi:hypothetical protein
MKATLAFTLPEEQHEFDSAIQGGEAISLLWRIDQYLRGLVKHGEPSGETRELAEAVRAMIRESTVSLE